jgi:hypothetical protein
MGADARRVLSPVLSSDGSRLKVTRTAHVVIFGGTGGAHLTRA